LVVYLLKNKIKCGYCGSAITSESGTAKNGSVKRYYKCSKRKKAQACNKSTVRKDIIENLVISVTKQFLKEEKNVELIAEKIMKKQVEKMKDESLLNILETERTQVKKSIDNLIKAMEQGIITNSTKERIESLEMRLTELNEQIILEKTKKKMVQSKQEIICNISKAIEKEPKQMIKLLIKEIILYDDKVEIYYNFIEDNSPDGSSRQGCLIYRENKEYKTNDYNYKEQGFVLKFKVELYL